MCEIGGSKGRHKVVDQGFLMEVVLFAWSADASSQVVIVAELCAYEQAFECRCGLLQRALCDVRCDSQERPGAERARVLKRVTCARTDVSTGTSHGLSLGFKANVHHYV